MGLAEGGGRNILIKFNVQSTMCAVYVFFAAGETEEQYLATEALVRRIGFDRVNTAAYSPRPNTPAAEWDNQVGRTMSCFVNSSCSFVRGF